MTPGPTLTMPEVSPGASMACARVMPGVGFGSLPRASFVMRRRSDVAFVPALHVVGAPALVLPVELGAALRDPVVHQALHRAIVREPRDRVMVVGALELPLVRSADVREHRHTALVAFERAVRLELPQDASDVHRCALSALPATLCRTALAYGRGAFSPRTRAPCPHWQDPRTSTADPRMEAGTAASVHTSSCTSSSRPPTKSA